MFASPTDRDEITPGMDERARDFVQLAMRLYSVSPEGALAALTRHAVNQLEPLKSKAAWMLPMRHSPFAAA